MLLIDRIQKLLLARKIVLKPSNFIAFWFAETEEQFLARLTRMEGFLAGLVIGEGKLTKDDQILIGTMCDFIRRCGWILCPTITLEAYFMSDDFKRFQDRPNFRTERAMALPS